MAKNKLQRFAEMAEMSNVFQPGYDEVFRKDYRLKGRWCRDIFGNENPLVLEIGCGKGEYSVGLARALPEKNFIGIDIKGARMWKGAKSALEEGLKNVAFLRTYAENLQFIFAPDEVDEIWITFPDPQMSKARKRLTGSRFLKEYRKFLKPNGKIHLKSDSNFLFTYTSELIKANNLPYDVICSDLYGNGALEPQDSEHTPQGSENSNLSGSENPNTSGSMGPNPEIDSCVTEIKTFYEEHWLSRGKSIKYIKFSLGDVENIIEPDVEIEKDDYRIKFYREPQKSPEKL